MRIFGPVPSRRLGYSLGVDPVPFKTCTLDCLYCQLGPTPHTTLERKEYAPAGEILDELGERLKEGGRIDFVTFSGSGEPALHSKIGEMIRAVKRMTEIPVAVLTNGTLLHNPAVRKDLSAADLVLPSLDAGSEETFLRANRPHPGISFDNVVKGLEELSGELKWRIWLEVMLLSGINDNPGELGRMAAIIKRIHPGKVQINTVERPPASGEAKRLTAGELERARRLLQDCIPAIPVEVVAGFRERGREAVLKNVRESVLAYLRRRPATAEDLSTALGLPPNEVTAHLEHLHRAGMVERKDVGAKVYFAYKEAADTGP